MSWCIALARLRVVFRHSALIFSLSLAIKLLFADAPRGDVEFVLFECTFRHALSAEDPQLLRKFIFNGIISATRKLVFGRFANFWSGTNFAGRVTGILQLSPKIYSCKKNSSQGTIIYLNLWSARDDLNMSVPLKEQS